MAPFIEAIADPTHGYIYIETNWTDTPTVTYVRVVRIDVGSGVETVVRAHTSTDTTGEYIELNGGWAVLFDTEAPLDRATAYRAEGYNVATTTDTGTITNVLNSGGQLWLKDPVRPASDLPITLKTPTGPECLPGLGVFFQSMDGENLNGRGGSNLAINSKYAAPVSRTRGGNDSNLNLIARTFIDRDTVIAALAPGSPLLFQGPAHYGITDRYVHCGGQAATVTRLSTDHRRQWRLINIPYEEMGRPAGMPYGTLGSRWADLCTTTYSTFNAATAAALDWLGVVRGQAGTSRSYSVTAPWRTYTTVKAQFATYSAFSTKTYRALLEGH